MARPSSPIESLPVPTEFIERRIYLIRGQKVMLDSDLAELYQVETRILIQAVKRNNNRFPVDFMFQLTDEEARSLRSQFVISNLRFRIGTSRTGRGGRRYLPYAFTEHGVAMLSSVLKSGRAVQMSIFIVRAFVKLRQLLASHKELAAKVEQLESTQKEQGLLLALVVKDIQNLDKKVMKEIKKLKTQRKRKFKIGFAT